MTPAHYESSDKLWRRGCRGEALEGNDLTTFRAMARNRFNTFEMSAAHATENKSDADASEWIDLLIRGLATELLENPGLEREWHGSDFSDRLHGRRVTLQVGQPLG